MRAAAVLKGFADRLEEGREKVKRLQEQAEEAQRRMNSAAAGAVEAGRLEGDARARATSMSLSATLDPTGSSFTEQNQAYADADAYAGERMRLEGVATRARDELERLQEQARLEREAVKEAATAASGQMNGAQDGLPVVYHGGMYGTAGAMEDRVLARVRAGDYDVLTGLSINTLDEDTQRAVGAEIAKDADEAAYNEGDHSLEEVSSVVSRFGTDNEFASGFYNQLGGRGTADLAQNIVFFHGRGEGLDDPALLALMAPFANMLGTATRSGALRPGFTSGFMRKDLSVRDRYGGHEVMSAFVMSGTASRYSPAFLSAVGEEVLITPSANPDDGINFHELSDNQDLMEFIADNPEAAAQLLAGHHGPGNHFSNAAPLMMYGPRYTDDGDALGSLIRAGTHDALAYDRATAIDAGETIIKITPEFADHMPDGTKDALVTILDDHVGGFEYAAVHEANPSGAYVRGDTVDISIRRGPQVPHGPARVRGRAARPDREHHRLAGREQHLRGDRLRRPERAAQRPDEPLGRTARDGHALRHRRRHLGRRGRQEGRGGPEVLRGQGDRRRRRQDPGARAGYRHPGRQGPGRRVPDRPGREGA